LKEKGINVSLTAVLSDMEIRDNQDRERRHSPLTVAHDSIIVDSTKKSIDVVVTEILNYHEKIY